MEFSFNWLAILAATLSAFVVGFLWYGPLLGKAWMEAAGISKEQVDAGNMIRTFSLAFVLQLIMAFCLAMFFYGGGEEAAALINATNGALYGFLTGFGWVAAALSVTALFEQRSFRYMAINGGYWVVVFTLMGLILGAWK
ncbi:MAG: DUF1761 domain-containing protein [Gammaproteobacteria bacterium]|nr:DUF1761 domain-containing protein [Pseudomonadales bacterium]MCP5348476.1 DUF1761 domain-containing protein [Pseudomonadales bacterium]